MIFITVHVGNLYAKIKANRTLDTIDTDGIVGYELSSATPVKTI